MVTRADTTASADAFFPATATAPAASAAVATVAAALATAAASAASAAALATTMVANVLSTARPRGMARLLHHRCAVAKDDGSSLSTGSLSSFVT